MEPDADTTQLEAQYTALLPRLHGAQKSELLARVAVADEEISAVSAPFEEQLAVQEQVRQLVADTCADGSVPMSKHPQPAHLDRLPSILVYRSFKMQSRSMRARRPPSMSSRTRTAMRPSLREHS